MGKKTVGNRHVDTHGGVERFPITPWYWFLSFTFSPVSFVCVLICFVAILGWWWWWGDETEKNVAPLDAVTDNRPNCLIKKAGPLLLYIFLSPSVCLLIFFSFPISSQIRQQGRGRKNQIKHIYIYNVCIQDGEEEEEETSHGL